jgi:hypothetical protein
MLVIDLPFSLEELTIPFATRSIASQIVSRSVSGMFNPSWNGQCQANPESHVWLVQYAASAVGTTAAARNDESE